MKVVPKYLNSSTLSKLRGLSPRANYTDLHPLRGTIINLHAVSSPCILISRHDHVLSFISIYF